MDKIFDKLKNIFKENGYHLYMIGSTSRDYLLGNKINDYDLVSDATPDEVKKFLDVEMTYAKYGTTKYYVDGNKIDIITLREEGKYFDHRHPSYIKFVKDINIDYRRRDFTINAIYIDEDYKVIDPTLRGVKDLENKVLTFIGDPKTRIEEDPLRILRARRFIKEYNLKVDDNTKYVLENNNDLLKYINKDKIKEEENKYKSISR
ncbi:MAG: hypothetical protein WCR97_05620 [Bacilli bacterium]